MGKSPQKTSLGFKILAWSFVPTAIILLLVALTAYYAYQRQTEQIAINQGGEVNRLSASEVSSGFEDFIDRLTILARDPSVYYGLIAQQQMALNSSSNRLILFDGGVFILDNLGKVIAASIDRKDIIGQDWSNRTFFLSMVRSPGIFFTNIEPYGVDGSDVIAIAVPILGSQNDFRGIVVGMFRLDASTVNPFYGTILKMRIGEVGNAYLVDGNQRIIFSSDFKQNGSQLTDPKMTSLLRGGVGSIERITTADGKEVLLGYDPVPRTSWSLITAEDWSVMVRPSERYRTLLIALLILGVIVPTGFVMVGVRRITRPVDDFIAAAQRIASGDFSQPIQLNTNDEMEELAEQFNRMAEKLQESYDTLEQRVEQRTHELTAVNTVSAVVSRSLDLDRILADALDKTLEVMGMEAGVVYRLDVEMKTLQLVAQRGVDELSIKIFQYVPVTISVVQEVLETQLPMAFTIEDYPPGPLRESLAAAGIKTVVSIPLVAQDQMLGAMNVATREDFHLSFEALSVAAAIGQQIGVAIDNARLYEQSVAYAQDAEKSAPGSRASTAGSRSCERGEK